MKRTETIYRPRRIASQGMGRNTGAERRGPDQDGGGGGGGGGGWVNTLYCKAARSRQFTFTFEYECSQIKFNI